MLFGSDKGLVNAPRQLSCCGLIASWRQQLLHAICAQHVQRSKDLFSLR